MAAVDMHWQVQQVKQRLSEVLRAAESEGPQYVTRHGQNVAVVVSIEDFHRLSGGDEPRPSFLEQLLAAPKLTDEEHHIAYGEGRPHAMTGMSFVDDADAE